MDFSGGGAVSSSLTGSGLARLAPVALSIVVATLVDPGPARGQKRSAAMTASRATTPTRVSWSRRRAVRSATGLSASMPLSRLSPSGVSSYSHEKTTAGTKPMASSAIRVFITQAGVS